MQTGGCCSLVSLAQASPPLDQALMFTDEYCGLAGMSLKIPYQAHPQSQFSHTPMGAAIQPDPSPNTFPVGIQPSKDNPKEPLPDLALNTAFASTGRCYSLSRPSLLPALALVHTDGCFVLSQGSPLDSPLWATLSQQPRLVTWSMEAPRKHVICGPYSVSSPFPLALAEQPSPGGGDGSGVAKAGMHTFHPDLF